MTDTLDCALIGKWRIVEADLWDRDYLDLMDPAHISFDDQGGGEVLFGCLNGALDCEYSPRIIFFTWNGSDEMDEVDGDGSADLNDDGTVEIEFRYNNGDEAILKARKW